MVAGAYPMDEFCYLHDPHPPPLEAQIFILLDPAQINLVLYFY